MLSIIPVFLMFFSSFLQDPSGSWIPSANSSKSEFFIKSKYISKVGSKITIWVKQVPKVSEEKDGKKIAFELILEECDCNNFSTRSLSLVEYTESGESINSFNFKDAEVTYAPPGSVAYRYISDICSRFNKKKK